MKEKKNTALDLSFLFLFLVLTSRASRFFFLISISIFNKDGPGAKEDYKKEILAPGPYLYLLPLLCARAEEKSKGLKEREREDYMRQPEEKNKIMKENSCRMIG